MPLDPGIFNYNPAPIEPPVNALLRGLQMQHMQRQNALQGVQLQNAQAQQAQAAEAQRRQQAIESAYRNALMSPLDQAGAAGMTRPTPANAAALGQMTPQVDQQRLIQGLAQASPMDAYKMLTPNTEIKEYREIRNADGSVSVVGLTKDGKVVQTNQTPFIKSERQDFGGYVGAVDPLTNKVTKLGDKTMSAAERDSSARGWAGLAETRQQNALPVFDSATGVFVNRKTQTVTPAIGPDGKPLGSKQEAADQKAKVRDANDALAIINQAEKLIGQATGSYGGNVIDKIPQVFGASTAGADAAAKLKALEGVLVSKMPKMSGPQSDKDVLLYRQMAGMIGDANIPADQKRAALDTVREIQERYAGIPAGGSRPKGPSFQLPGDPNTGAMDFSGFKVLGVK